MATSASYSWPVYNLLDNGSFPSNLGSWTTSGSVAYLGTDGSTANGCAEFAGAGSMYQDRIFKQWDTTTDPGRWVDENDWHALDLYVKEQTTGLAVGVQLFLLDGSSNFKYSWDWFNGKWKKVSAASGGVVFYFRQASTGAWTRFVLPPVEPPAFVDSDLADNWRFRVRLVGTGSSGSIRVDDIRFMRWTGKIRTARVGEFLVMGNGRNYPVKWHPRSGTVTELSLPEPYPHTALPTTTVGTTGGELSKDQYFGFAYTNLNKDVGEESGIGIGIQSTSATFLEDTTGSATDTNKITVDSSPIVIPNAETAKSTDSSDVDGHVFYRTLAYSTAEEAETALADGNLYYDAEVDVDGSYAATAQDGEGGDGTLPGLNGLATRPVPRMRAPMPGGRYLLSYRGRLFTAAPPGSRLGNATVTNGSHTVTGIDEDDASDAPTLWGRVHERASFLVDGESRPYLIERYVYPEDNGSGQPEALYLADAYAGTSGTVQATILPDPGVVFYSEEGMPYAWAETNILYLDGGQDPVTGIIDAGEFLLLTTRRQTFAVNWNENPAEIPSSEAPVLSRALGCISHDSQALIDGTAYWLSDRGVVRWTSGMAEPELISTPLQAMFTDPDDPLYVIRERSSQLAEWCQGVHYPARSQYLLAVRTKESRGGCDKVLVWNYIFNSWDVLHLDAELVTWSFIVDDDGNDVLVFTDTSGRTWVWDTGYTDGAGEPEYTGSLSGTVTATDSFNLSLTDSGAAFYRTANSNVFSGGDELDLAGCYVEFLSGKNAGLKRRIEANTATTLYWAEALPASLSVGDAYRIGSIKARLKTKFSNFGLPGRVKRILKTNVDHRQELFNGPHEVRYYTEFDESASLASKQGVSESTFRSSDGGRSMVPHGYRTEGYNLALEVHSDGAEKPLEIYSLSIQYLAGEPDV